MKLTIPRSASSLQQRSPDQLHYEYFQVPQYENASSNPEHRLSNKELSPELESPIPVWSEESAKEVVYGQASRTDDYLQSQWQHAYLPEPSGSEVKRSSDDSREYCGMRRKPFFVLIASIFLVLLAIALGIGLGLGLKHSHKSYVDTAVAFN